MFQAINQMIARADVGSLMIVFLSALSGGLAVVTLAGTWRVYEKAGKPGWACLVPVYNFIVLLEIAGERWWCILLMIVPGLNAIVYFLVVCDVARRFGKGTLFALGLIFAGFVFYPILGLGRARYQPLT
jgi:uncharacterized protein DUF5684